MHVYTHSIAQFTNLSSFVDQGEGMVPRQQSATACAAPFARVACARTCHSHKWSVCVCVHLPGTCASRRACALAHFCSPVANNSCAHSRGPEVGDPCSIELSALYVFILINENLAQVSKMFRRLIKYLCRQIIDIFS